jgi:acyl carrier protein
LELEREIGELIIASLNLEDVTVEDIDPEAPLFGSGLGLDSIDALELGLAIHKRYGIAMGDSDEVRQHFASVRRLAAFVAGARQR